MAQCVVNEAFLLRETIPFSQFQNQPKTTVLEGILFDVGRGVGEPRASKARTGAIFSLYIKNNCSDV